MAASLYWHDYETWGADPSRDRACQFAGIRTDLDLNVVGDPLVIYNRPTPDMLPHPEACLVTGITPQTAQQGLSEREFIARIHAQMAAADTCVVGYNNIRFDDEVTRYTLYRNFYDPYAREWQNGNSRWDLIDMVRLTYALRPEGIQWPLRENGKPSFRLENLTVANGISHAAAHDALSDVHATIAIARLIKTQQPKLYEYVFAHRDKRRLAQLIDVKACKPVLHISSMFSAEHGCAALVMPLAMHPSNKNAIICYDLSVDPRPLIELGVSDIQARLFTRREDLPEGCERIALKAIHVNKCPIVLTAKMLDADAAQRLNIDVGQCRRHYEMLLAAKDCVAKVQQAFGDRSLPAIADPDRMLYSGGFFGHNDKRLIDEVREASGQDLSMHNFAFEDRRLPELLFRYRARNFPETLNPDETLQWLEFCKSRLTLADEEFPLGFDAFKERVFQLLDDPEKTVQQREILMQLQTWGEYLEDALKEAVV